MFLTPPFCGWMMRQIAWKVVRAHGLEDIMERVGLTLHSIR